MDSRLEQSRLENTQKEDADLLRRYFDGLARCKFYGQIIISMECGEPVQVKAIQTLRMADIKKLVDKI